MKPDTEAIYQRIAAGLGVSAGLNNLAEWLVRHTTLPDGRPWGYKDHEFQVQIADDMSRRMTVKKCSQVGLSELSVRKTLAYMANVLGQHIIYTLPTSKFAGHFAKTRFDPVIAGSKVLRDMVNRDVDSTEVKQIGSNFLYIKGTMGQSAAISVPASMVVQDEVDFCDQNVLTTYASRLRHAEEGGFLWKFSTPTVKGYGISAAFELSDQRVYMCKCRCGYEDVPDFDRDMRVPGHDIDFSKFHKDMLQDKSIPWQAAVMCCPKCGEPWPLEDPERRRWVATRTEVSDHTGYWVRPWDAPKYNTAYGILSQAELYESHADWKNFVLGEEHEDTENSVSLDTVVKNTVLEWVNPDVGGSGCVFGCDVGKVSNIVIGKPTSNKDGWLDVIYMERIVSEGDGRNVADRIIWLAKKFGCIRGVVDAMPDFTTALSVVEGLPTGVAYANYYTEVDPKKMSMVSVKDDRILHSNRTKTISALVQAINNGFVRFPRHDEMRLMKDHLTNMKKVRRVSSYGGDDKEFWVKTGPDHYAHALNYAMIAARTIRDGIRAGPIPVLPSVGGASVGGVRMKTDEKPAKKELYAERKRRELFL
jgi:hypothetical protein